MQFRQFPKGDARRYLVILLVIADLPAGAATLHQVAAAAQCNRSEVQRAIQILEQQFGVTFDRLGSAYLISSWGMLRKEAVVEHLGQRAEEPALN